MSSDIEESIKRLAIRLAADGRSPDCNEYTAELLDENDEDGVVVINDRDGWPLAYMPRSVYEAIRRRTGT